MYVVGGMGGGVGVPIFPMTVNIRSIVKYYSIIIGMKKFCLKRNWLFLFFQFISY